MWTRRKFISSALSSYISWSCYASIASMAAGSRGRKKCDPHLLNKEYWPAAISANYIDVFGDNLCCMADEFGRIATADILSANQHSRIYPILGELNNPGHKILFLKILQSQSAIIISQKQDNKNNQTTAKYTEERGAQNTQFVCQLISLAPVQEPKIISSIVLTNYSQLSAFAVGQVNDRPIICIAGLDQHGDNRISLYGLKGKGKLQTISTFKLKDTAKTLVLGSDSLLVLNSNSQAILYSLANIVSPQFIRTVTLSDEVINLASYGDLCAWSMQKESKYLITLSDIKTFPKPISQLEAKTLLSVEALSMNNKYVLALGSNEKHSLVLPFLIDKNHSLRAQEPVKLQGYIESNNSANKMVIGKDAAFISSGWAGMQVLSINHGIWSASTYYGLQRLPIAGLITWSNYLILGGAELQLYDLSQPKHPKLLNTAKLNNTIKAIATAGSYVLCLDKLGLTLRRIESPEAALIKFAITAEHLSFDKQNHKAYLIQSEQSQDKDKNKIESSKLVELNVYNNSIQKNKSFSILSGAYCLSADEGHVLVGNLDSLAIYKADEENELICKREFKDLAWREIVFIKGNIFATAIDQNVNGYFLTMSFDGQSINQLNSIKLPHDGIALTIKDDLAFAAGQNINGNSLLTTIDISNTAKPKILNTKPTLPSASAISTSNNLLIVGGQGFEIFSI